MAALRLSREVVGYILNEPSNRGRRIYRLARGLGWQIRKRLTRRPVLVRLWNGRLFLADPADEMASFALYAHVFDSRHTLFAAAVADNGAMVDVGANVGLFSLQLSHRFTDAVLYEASPEAARKARENMMRNGLDRYRIKAVALGESEGRIRFSTGHATGLTNRMLEDGEESAGPIVEVPLTTLDRDLEPAIKSHLAFLKIDVEGAEAQVLAGARETLAASPRLLIMFERLKRTPLEPLVRLLADYGYVVFALSAGLPDRTAAALEAAHDLFACRADRLEEVASRAAAARPDSASTA